MTTVNSVGNGLSGSTGTVHFVGSTSPTLVTPTLGAATATSIEFSGNNGLLDSNGNEILKLSPTGSAVNYVLVTNNATGSAPILTGSGSDSNIALQLKGTGNLGAEVLGRTDGNNSGSGYVGQIITSSVAFVSGVSLTTNQAKNITSISVTAGNWLIIGNVLISNGSGDLEAAYGGINTTTNTLPDNSTIMAWNGSSSDDVNDFGGAVSVPEGVVSISSTTIYYLVGEAVSSGGTNTGSGYITAVRIS